MMSKLSHGWKTLPIGEIFELSQYGLSIPSSEAGTIPILGMKDLQDGKVSLLNITSKVSLSDDDLGKFALRDGDILLNRTNSLDLVGKVGLFEGNETVVFASYLIRFRVNQRKANPKYVSYFLNSADSKLKLRALATPSISQANINPTVFQKKFQILLPPLPEQERIAAILSTWDEAIAKTQALIEFKQQEKMILSKKFLLASNHKSNISKLSEIAQTYSGGTPSRRSLHFYSGKIPWIKSGEINNRYIEETSEFISEEALKSSSAKWIYPGTTLIAMYGATAGKVAISKIKATINQAILAVVPKDDINPNYLFFSIEANIGYVTSLVQGSQPNLNASIIKELEIYLPEKTKQDRLESFFTELDRALQIMERQLFLLKRQKQGLMQKLLSGAWSVASAPQPQLQGVAG